MSFFWHFYTGSTVKNIDIPFKRDTIVIIEGKKGASYFMLLVVYLSFFKQLLYAR